MTRTLFRCAALLTLTASFLLAAPTSGMTLTADGGVLPGIPPVFAPHALPVLPLPPLPLG